MLLSPSLLHNDAELSLQLSHSWLKPCLSLFSVRQPPPSLWPVSWETAMGLWHPGSPHPCWWRHWSWRAAGHPAEQRSVDTSSAAVSETCLFYWTHWERALVLSIWASEFFVWTLYFHRCFRWEIHGTFPKESQQWQLSTQKIDPWKFCQNNIFFTSVGSISACL